jgi:hypothetical protein
MTKRVLFHTVFAVIASAFFTACAARQTAAEKEAAAAEIRNALEMFEFRFDARHAHPIGFRSVHLTPHFDVRVSPDTVHVNLPFFGRAFRAPMPPTEGGYRFTSTDFEHSVVPGRRAGNWLVQIAFRDLNREVIFNFDVWESGSTRLSINDIDRQGISFLGEVEVD